MLPDPVLDSARFGYFVLYRLITMLRIFLVTLVIIIVSVAVVRSCFFRKQPFDPDTATVNFNPGRPGNDINPSDSTMPDSIKAEIAEHIHYYVQSGFYEREETIESIYDGFYDEAIDETWLRQRVDSEYSTRLQEQANWSAETGFDRLVKVFDQLNTSGIIALHNAGYTKQDGEGDAEDIYEELKKNGIVAKGYCYYHAQDVGRAVDDGRLYIGFGDFDDDNNKALAIGKQIADALKAQGFRLNWNKTVETRIEIINLPWQKRFGNQDCSAERAIRLLSGR
jgi:hypothetical protein